MLRKLLADIDRKCRGILREGIVTAEVGGLLGYAAGHVLFTLVKKDGAAGAASAGGG